MSGTFCFVDCGWEYKRNVSRTSLAFSLWISNCARITNTMAALSFLPGAHAAAARGGGGGKKTLCVSHARSGHVASTVTSSVLCVCGLLYTCVLSTGFAVVVSNR